MWLGTASCARCVCSPLLWHSAICLWSFVSTSSAWYISASILRSEASLLFKALSMSFSALHRSMVSFCVRALCVCTTCSASYRRSGADVFFSSFVVILLFVPRTELIRILSKTTGVARVCGPHSFSCSRARCSIGVGQCSVESEICVCTTCCRCAPVPVNSCF